MPRVSIALPVYNGGRFVSDAVSSLLAQTFRDFELVIVDNASTDGTSDVCRAFAASDSRVRYHRNERNIGGGPNWNLAFELANRAPYFKWAAHDDRHGPQFLERCVEALDRDPGVVLAFTRAEYMDGEGKTIQSRSLSLPLDAPDAPTRFQSLFEPYYCLEIFGVMRRSAMLARPAMGQYADGDGVLLARLALMGRFHEVPEAHFFCRRHPTQATSKFSGNYRKWALWWDPSLEGKRVFPQWRRQRELWRSLAITPLSTHDRVRCVLALLRWAKWTKHLLYYDAAHHVKEILGATGGGRPGQGVSGGSP